jgi:hypothetical protein
MYTMMCEFCRAPQQVQRKVSTLMLGCKGKCGSRTPHYPPSQFPAEEGPSGGTDEDGDDCAGESGCVGTDAGTEEVGEGGGSPLQQPGNLQHPAGGNEGSRGAVEGSDEDLGERGSHVSRVEAGALIPESRSTKKSK